MLAPAVDFVLLVVHLHQKFIMVKQKIYMTKFINIKMRKENQMDILGKERVEKRLRYVCERFPVSVR